MNPLGLFALPCAREDVYFVPSLGGSDSRRQAVFLEAAEGIVIIEDETDLHVGMRTWAENRGNAKSA